MRQLNKRDDNGFRIPRKGTLSYRIYKLWVEGKTPREITDILKTDHGTVRVLIHRFKHPDTHNSRSNNGYHNRKEVA